MGKEKSVNTFPGAGETVIQINGVQSHTGRGKVEPIRGYIAQRKTDNYIMKSKDAVFLIKTPGNPVKGKNNVFPGPEKNVPPIS